MRCPIASGAVECTCCPVMLTVRTDAHRLRLCAQASQQHSALVGGVLLAARALLVYSVVGATYALCHQHTPDPGCLAHSTHKCRC